MAARAGKADIVRQLLNNDADPYIESENGTAKDIAFLCNHQEIIDIFESYEREALEHYNSFMAPDSNALAEPEPAVPTSSALKVPLSPRSTPVTLTAASSKFGSLSATFSVFAPTPPHTPDPKGKINRKPTSYKSPPPAVDPRLALLNMQVEQSDASTIYGLQYQAEEDSRSPNARKLNRQTVVCVPGISARLILSHPLFNVELGSRSREATSSSRASIAKEGSRGEMCIPSDVSLEYSDEHDSFWYTQEFVKPDLQAIEPLKRKCLLSDTDFRPHLNLHGTLDSSRIILSVVLEPNNSGDYRVILRRAAGERLFFLSGRDIASSYGHKKFIPQLLEQIEAKCPGLSSLVIVEDLSFKRSLVELELILKIRKYKFGVVCVREGMSEEDIFSHNDYSPAYNQFLHFLGTQIELQGWTGYKGDLDVKNGGTGTHAFHTEFSGMEIIFQSASLLPEIRRKPIIGNTISTIVFQESGSFDPSLIVSQVLHVFVVVQPVQTAEGTFYRVGIVSKKGVPRYRPSLLLPAIFPPTPEFRHFLLTKLINGERASYHCFSKTASQRRSLVEIVQQTRLGQLEFAISSLPLAPATSRDRKMSIAHSLSGIIRRKKDKKERSPTPRDS